MDIGNFNKINYIEKNKSNMDDCLLYINYFYANKN